MPQLYLFLAFLGVFAVILAFIATRGKHHETKQVVVMTEQAFARPAQAVNFKG